MSTDKVSSEDTSAAAAKRRVSVRRTTAETLNKRLETARTELEVTRVKATLHQEHADIVAELQKDRLNDIAKAEGEYLEKGIEQGKEIAMADYDAMLDESVNNRLCDNERNMPWPVGVIIAGEQHRILQALAEWFDEMDAPLCYSAQTFARRLGIIHYPEQLDAPSAVTYRNCDEPPKSIERDQKGNQVHLEAGDAKLPGYTEHWKYYLRQIEDSTD